MGPMGVSGFLPPYGISRSQVSKEKNRGPDRGVSSNGARKTKNTDFQVWGAEVRFTILKLY